MRVMLFEQANSPLRWSESDRPEPAPDQVLLRVKACGVCRTDLHVCDGELTQPKRPLILGHEIVGIVEAVGGLVPQALRCLDKGGAVVCGGIHMSDIPRFPYELLWGERGIRSVANLTRRDGEEFLRLAPQVPVRTEVQTFALSAANEALSALREGRLRGAAAVLVP